MLTRSKWLAGLAASALAVSLAPVIGLSTASAAERPDSLGKDFWVAFPQNYLVNPELSLFISGPTATSGTVSVPGIGFSENFSVVPGSVTTVSIPSGAQLGDGSSGDPENKGVRVTAAEEVSVYGLNRRSASTDAFLGLPVDVMTTEYIALGWPAPGVANDLNSELSVVATEDGTDVTIVPTADTTSGVTAGTATTKTLNRGEALPVQSSTGDLSGSMVTSSKPVSVFGGHKCANVPNNSTVACDFVVEQLPGTGTWGKSFLTVPLKTRLNGDTFRFVAKEDNTAVTVNGAVVATLNKGQVHQQIIDGQSTVTADKPILMAQYSNGTGYDNVTSDPFMMLTTPTEQFLSDYTFTTPATGFSGNYVNIVAPSAVVGDVKVDGSAIPASAFTPIGSSGFSGAQVDLALGSHTVNSPRPVGIYVYGFDDADSYGYPGGAAYAAINEVASLTLTPPSQQVTVNKQACVTAKIADKNGKGLPGIEVNLKASGVNTVDKTELTDSAGTYQYCYSSTAAGTDTFTATYSTLSASATVQWASTPEPEPEPEPTKKKQLPIKVKGVKKSPVSLGPDNKVVLVKKIRTNTKGKTAVRAQCRPAKSSAAGEVRFCDVTVSKKGRVTVRSTGYDRLKVTVKVRATPKKGEKKSWKKNSWTRTWKVRP
ncbi:MAG: Ig-like domain-containing protein [Actinobacteria bacterium]|nr:Ig-like domain-containing protein [Actinomycetota bacterium]